MILSYKNILTQQLNAIFDEALEKKIFLGAAVGISLWNGSEYENLIFNFGFAHRHPVKVKISNDVYFDLASLTKPLATVPALLSLMEKNEISWNSTLSEIFLHQIPEDKAFINIKQLMSHCSGLPDHVEYFKKLLKIPKNKRKKTIFNWILQEKLKFIPGTDILYSDLGFMLLGFIIEKLSGKNLDKCIKKIYSPFSLQNSLIFTANKKKKDLLYAATATSLWTGKMLSGEVHDDNCRAMEGVAGHAGLFGTIEGVLQWCQYFLSQFKDRTQHPFYNNELLRMAVKKEGMSAWTPGFDTPSLTGSTSGQFFSTASFGHLGFTGTSFWIDPDKELIIVLLTNRVFFKDNHELMKRFRPLFHDTVMRCLQMDKK